LSSSSRRESPCDISLLKLKNIDLSSIITNISNTVVDSKGKIESYYPYPIYSVDYLVYIPPKKEVEAISRLNNAKSSIPISKSGFYNNSSLKWLLSPARTIFFNPALANEKYILAVRFISTSKNFSKWSVGCCCFFQKQIYQQEMDEENITNFNVMIENFNANYEPLNMGKTPISVRYQANGEIVYGSFGYPKGNEWKIGVPMGSVKLANTSSSSSSSSSSYSQEVVSDDDEFFSDMAIGNSNQCSSSRISSSSRDYLQKGEDGSYSSYVDDGDNVGTVVVVELDCKNGTIQFFLDGIPQKQAFINVNTLGRITQAKMEEYLPQLFYFFVRAGDQDTVVDVVNFGMVSGGKKVERGVVWGGPKKKVLKLKKKICFFFFFFIPIKIILFHYNLEEVVLG
jgi:hypothetical protein